MKNDREQISHKWTKIKVVPTPNKRLILAFQRQTKNTSAWSERFFREFCDLWWIFWNPLFQAKSACFSKEILWKFEVPCLKQRISENSPQIMKFSKKSLEPCWGVFRLLLKSKNQPFIRRRDDFNFRPDMFFSPLGPLHGSRSELHIVKHLLQFNTKCTPL